MMVSKVDYIWMKGETCKPFPTFSDDTNQLSNCFLKIQIPFPILAPLNQNLQEKQPRKLYL